MLLLLMLHLMMILICRSLLISSYCSIRRSYLLLAISFSQLLLILMGWSDLLLLTWGVLNVAIAGSELITRCEISRAASMLSENGRCNLHGLVRWVLWTRIDMHLGHLDLSHLLLFRRLVVRCSRRILLSIIGTLWRASGSFLPMLIVLGFFLMPGRLREEKLGERVLGTRLSHLPVWSRRFVIGGVLLLEAGLARSGEVVLILDRCCCGVIVCAGSAVRRGCRCWLVAGI